ncbi:DUF1285 domain-containing protein [Rhizobiaceae bacterium BDR2-2]|uniref:DUF1285 domain-containing protein n=1 Tax=Ectorhizobium quercum TaxID=2965071 RepID=A0AAE3MX35_9HYPH|nr:DUF1285 domain-containing protein [Ectorhizobium quercum]MCX8996598.1 DUF1285 domain-containing protein [Ectorhizobium quercum]
MAGDEKQADRGADGLSALIARAREISGDGKKGLPPVERWNPPFCGDLDMEIRADGQWFYLGTPIGRMPLVRLFSTVLRKDEDGKTYLVTPVEKVGIRVADAPFLAVEMTAEGEGETQRLTFRTNLGDVVTADAEHPLRFETAPDGGLKPYLLVRGRLEALLTRALTQDLVALGEALDAGDVETFCLRSSGAVFPVMPLAELERLSA